MIDDLVRLVNLRIITVDSIKDANIRSQVQTRIGQ